MSKKLIDAIYELDQAKVKKLLEKGSDPNLFYKGLSPLVEACGKSTKAVVEELLKAGAEVNQSDENFKHSPLTSACYAGNLEIAELLVDHGADVNYSKENVSTPLSEAASGAGKEREAMVEFLLQVGADAKA